MNYEEQLIFMKEALKEADKAADMGEVPVGAVIVKDGEVISRGFNKTESQQSSLAHAELEAIDKASKILGNWRLVGCEMYVTLEPCAMCAGAIVLSRIEKLYYGAKDPKFGGCDSIFQIPTEEKLNHRVEVFGGLMGEESAEKMRNFFRELRNRKNIDKKNK